MARLTWGDPQARRYELGVNRGVIYPVGDTPTAWNGLVSVTESPDAEETESFYIDGVNYLTMAGQEDFAGTIEAYTRPRALQLQEGFRASGSLFVDCQPRRAFGLSYRTLIGTESGGIYTGYKVHLVYNVLLGSAERSYKTLGDDVDPLVFSWPFETTPKRLSGYRPTAHFHVESSDPHIGDLENVLYGTFSAPPRLPEPAELLTILGA